MKLYKKGEQINLSLKLPDKRTGVFPRAVVYNNLQQPILIEPLFHASNGYYTTFIQTAINPGSYTVVYEVFKDAAFNNPLRIYNDTEEFLRIENIQETITSESDRVIDLMDDSDGRATCF